MSMEKSKRSKTKNPNDFFNIESNEEDDENEEEQKELELEKKIRKWDWDKEENHSIYFNKKSTNNLKRSNQQEDDDSSASSSKKPYIPPKNIVDPNSKQPFIELVSNNDIDWGSNSIDEQTNPIKLKYNLVGHNSSVNRINWAKKSDHKNLILSCSNDGKLIVWNLVNKRIFKSNSFSGKTTNLRIINDVHTKPIRNAIWTNNDHNIISVSYDQSCALVNVETGRLLNRLRYSNILTSVSTTIDENLMLIGAKNEILVWDVRENNNRPAKIYKSQMGQVQDIVCLNENEFAASGDVTSKDSAEYSIMVWDLKSTACLSNQIFHEKYICTCLRKHPNNSLFYAQTHGNYIAEFSSRSPYKMNKNRRFESKNHITQGYSIGFDINQTGTLIASGSIDGCVYIYNTSNGKLVHKIDAFNKQIINQPCMDAKFQSSECLSNTYSSSNCQERQYLAVSSFNGPIKIYEF